MEITAKELFKTEIKNLELYGYGVKAFILSMIETAIRITCPSSVLEPRPSTQLFGICNPDYLMEDF